MKTLTSRIVDRMMPFVIAYRLSGNVVFLFKIRNGIDLRIQSPDRRYWYSWTMRGVGKDLVFIENLSTWGSDIMTYKNAVDAILTAMEVVLGNHE